MTQVGGYSGSWGGMLQLGSDGKIYYAHYQSQFYGVVNNPNQAGAACNYVELGQTLGAATCNLGTPNFVESVFLDAPGGSVNGCTVLDFELLNLEGVATPDRKVQLTWDAIEDANAKHYEIERSLDGENFVHIGTETVQNGVGDIHRYQHLDHGPGEGWNYYRLRLEDFNGQFSYSNTVMVKFDEAISGWVAYPVPVNGEFSLVRPMPRNGKPGHLSLYNELGQEVWQYKTSGDETNVKVGVEPLAAGMYHLRYTEGDQQVTMKIVVK